MDPLLRQKIELRISQIESDESLFKQITKEALDDFKEKFIKTQ